MSIVEPHAVRTRVDYFYPGGQGCAAHDSKATLKFSFTIDILPPGDRSEPVYVSVEQQGIDPAVVPPEAAGLRLFLDSVLPISETTIGTIPTDFPNVVLPSEVTTGQVLTLEAVDNEGRPLQPSMVIRRNVLAFDSKGAKAIVSSEDGELLLDPSVKGTIETARYLPSQAMLESLMGPQGVTGAAHAGSGCSLKLPGQFSRLPNILVTLSPIVVVLLWRRSRRRRDQAPGR